MTRSVAITAPLMLLFATGLPGDAGSTAADTIRIPPVRSAQPDQFAPAFAEIERWVAQRAFPGAVIAIGGPGRPLIIRSFGKMDASPAARPMRADTIFDVASLTKVVGTTTAAAILQERGDLDLDAHVVRYLPQFTGSPQHSQVTVRHLLSHTSGLDPTELNWNLGMHREDILNQIRAKHFVASPGTIVRYQDINMILLGEIIERITGQPLDRFLQATVFRPLGMRDTGFRPPQSKLGRIAPTENDRLFRHALIRGVVHDEKAYVMGGVAGHAGLFSTVHDLAKIAELYLEGGYFRGVTFLKPHTVALFSRRSSASITGSRALGWDKPADGGGFAGLLASPEALIHTGYTGTSMYIDPTRQCYVILLTNRVNPTRENLLINQARPAIHTAVLAAIDHE